MTEAENNETSSSLGFSGHWSREGCRVSMEEVFRSITVSKEDASRFRKFLTFAGPGYLVAVGYMDPGNWATSIAGGSSFGYTLLSIVLLSSVMAIILQSLCVRLAVGTGRDLAQACRDAFPAWFSILLWLLAELAIIATDLAEVIGTAIGLNLLFGLPLEIGVIVTALDVFFVLFLQNIGFRWIEAFILVLLGVISFCFVMQLVLAKPDWSNVILGFAPTVSIVSNPQMLYLALGIIGATVMPHNLYLHSGIVQTRAYGNSPEERHEAISFATMDSSIALCLAMLINASILILAAATFNRSGNYGVEDLVIAQGLLTPLLGSWLAPILFSVALLASGLSSTVTATMAGQIVMEGFINLKITPWVRRIITRGFAILPAIGVIVLLGPEEIGKLLILSQVVLSLQLPFAVVPLVMFTSDKKKMGEFISPYWLTVIVYIIAGIVIILNLKLLYDLIGF